MSTISTGSDLSSSQKINVVDFIILVYEYFLQDYVCMTWIPCLLQMTIFLVATTYNSHNIKCSRLVYKSFLQNMLV